MTSANASASAAVAQVILIVAAVIQNAAGQVLLVRKRGSQCYIQPGGKREPGENDAVTLARELQEELGVRIQRTHYLGEFEEQAVHETGHRVRAQVYFVHIADTPQAQAEIAELRWITAADMADTAIAPLSRKHILPRVFGTVE